MSFISNTLSLIRKNPKEFALALGLTFGLGSATLNKANAQTTQDSTEVSMKDYHEYFLSQLNSLWYTARINENDVFIFGVSEDNNPYGLRHPSATEQGHTAGMVLQDLENRFDLSELDLRTVAWSTLQNIARDGYLVKHDLIEIDPINYDITYKGPLENAIGTPNFQPGALTEDGTLLLLYKDEEDSEPGTPIIIPEYLVKIEYWDYGEEQRELEERLGLPIDTLNEQIRSPSVLTEKDSLNNEEPPEINSPIPYRNGDQETTLGGADEPPTHYNPERNNELPLDSLKTDSLTVDSTKTDSTSKPFGIFSVNLGPYGMANPTEYGVIAEVAFEKWGIKPSLGFSFGSIKSQEAKLDPIAGEPMGRNGRIPVQNPTEIISGYQAAISAGLAYNFGGWSIGLEGSLPLNSYNVQTIIQERVNNADGSLYQFGGNYTFSDKGNRNPSFGLSIGRDIGNYNAKFTALNDGFRLTGGYNFPLNKHDRVKEK